MEKRGNRRKKTEKNVLIIMKLTVIQKVLSGCNKIRYHEFKNRIHVINRPERKK